jgi:pimeloyl-ACP methyl ester carboxylesterase
MGPTPKAFAAARNRLDDLYEQHHRRVVVIGQSAGGLLARNLARQTPTKVRMVITLGSPIQMRAGDMSSVGNMTRRLEHRYDQEFRRLAEFQRGPLPVPATSVYTRKDGIVRWFVCLDVVDDRHENVAVRGTHSGMAINPATLLVIADRLQLPEDDWQPFRPPTLLRRLYPQPADWKDPAARHP